jgi:hypothetical protein
VSTQRYTVTPQPIETLLTWVKSGEIAIPEIQRPFVWESVKVRNLLDSLYAGFPVGYLIVWRNPTVRLKDGTFSAGKRILIDGQQRVTALMAALLGRQILTKDYDVARIKIGFNPIEERFEVANPAIERNSAWIPDISTLFGPDTDLLDEVESYVVANPGSDKKHVGRVLQRVIRIVGNNVGLIELSEDLDIETVTEIFIRVNSAGVTLSQADFAMSKIASNLQYGGADLRKAIDYFCHLSKTPDQANKIENADSDFAKSDFWQKIKWLKDANDDLYDPSYTDMLRVAFTSRFGRGKLQDLVALLSGRNFETKTYEADIAERSFSTLKAGILDFVDKTHFNRITMILRSAGLVTNDLIGGQNAVNFAYILYLKGRAEKLSADELERIVRRWYAMSILRGRYAGSPETAFDQDMRQINAQGLKPFVDTVVATELPESFWTGLLPQLMDTSSASSPYFQAYRAAQVNLGDKGFLSRDILVRDLLLNRADVHHFFPRNFLKKQNLPRSRYNQIANFVVAQTEINIAIGDSAPDKVFASLHDQISGGPLRYGGITKGEELKTNLEQNCVPLDLLEGRSMSFDEFLVERRKLMALRLKKWFGRLG